MQEFIEWLDKEIADCKKMIGVNKPSFADISTGFRIMILEEVREKLLNSLLEDKQ